MNKLNQNSLSLTLGIFIAIAWRWEWMDTVVHWAYTFVGFIILLVLANGAMMFLVMPLLMQNPYRMLEYQQFHEKLRPLMGNENHQDPLSILYCYPLSVGVAFLINAGIAEVALLQLLATIALSIFPFVVVIKLSFAWLIESVRS